MTSAAGVHRPGRPFRSLLAWCLLALAVGCSSGGGDAPSQGASGRLEVMTFNVYIGFGGPLFTGGVDFGDPEALAAALQQAFEDFQASDPTARLGALAQFLTDEEPDVVALQELVRLILTNGTTTTDDDVRLVDFVSFLSSELARRGGPDYQVFDVLQNQVEASLLFGDQQQEIRFEEVNALLVHPAHSAEALEGLRYSARIQLGTVQLPTGPQKAEVVRGVDGVRITAEGHLIDVFNTHLEIPGDQGQYLEIQQSQARELAAWLAERAATSPAEAQLLLGDFNATPDTPTYATIFAGGRIDSYGQVGTPPGWTCCQAETLDNPVSQASVRIDYIASGAGTAAAFNPIAATLGLTETVPRTEGPGALWPSDHFALLATLQLD